MLHELAPASWEIAAHHAAYDAFPRGLDTSMTLLRLLLLALLPPRTPLRQLLLELSALLRQEILEQLHAHTGTGIGAKKP
jgi:hypothetical protein